MPPITASSRVSLRTSRLVSSKRFITLALAGQLAGFSCAIMAASRLEDFAAGQERREDERGRSLRGDRLLDRPVDDELQLIEPGDRVRLDRQRLEHRPHGAADHGLAEVKL